MPLRRKTVTMRPAMSRAASAVLLGVATALLLGFQSVSAAELKIATWNLEWLTSRPAGDPALPSDVAPKREEDVVTLAGYASRLNADVVALQEVDGPPIAARLFPPERYV